jgi:peroxiredoxin
MDDEELENRPKGLAIGMKAPNFETKDVDNNDINLSEMLKKFDGVMIDFFRGNW